MDIIEERYRKEFEDHEKTAPLFRLAEQLINEYQQTDNIPVGKLKDIPNGFSEVDLLACCKLVEQKRSEAIIH